MILTAVLIPDPEGGFTALNPETGTTSQGESVEEAVANLREATELYLEEFPLRDDGSAAGHDLSGLRGCLACRGFPVPRPFARWRDSVS